MTEIKRTRFPNADPNFKPQIERLLDGRLLGPKAEDFVPPEFRHAIIEPKTSRRGRKPKAANQAKAIVRQRMPLYLTEDGEVDHEKYKFRIKGLNQARFNVFIAGMTLGMTRTGAARQAGIPQSSLEGWMRKGRDGREPYTYISGLIDAMEAELEERLILSLMEAATQGREWVERIVEREAYEDPATHEKCWRIVKVKETTKTRLPNPQYAAWLLERRFPDYRPPARNDSQGEDDGNNANDILAAMDAVTIGLPQ